MEAVAMEVVETEVLVEVVEVEVGGGDAAGPRWRVNDSTNARAAAPSSPPTSVAKASTTSVGRATTTPYTTAAPASSRRSSRPMK